jgi:hypothetical protein
MSNITSSSFNSCNLTMSDNKSVILDTSMGSIHIELYWDHAPKYA